MSRDAVTPERAVAFLADEPLERRVLARFLDCGVLIEVGRSIYYLDRCAYERWIRTTRKRGRFAVLALAVIIIALLVLVASAVFRSPS